MLRVRKLITLGSPHNPPPAESAMAKIDQTRGLLRYITENFPGKYRDIWPWSWPWPWPDIIWILYLLPITISFRILPTAIWCIWHPYDLLYLHILDPKICYPVMSCHHILSCHVTSWHDMNIEMNYIMSVFRYVMFMSRPVTCGLQ